MKAQFLVVNPARQHGSTLLVSMIMLILLTLIAISSMNASTSSIQVVGNSQFRQEALAAGQHAIEVVLSNPDPETNFMSIAPATQDVDVNNDGTADYRVTFDPVPSCLSWKPAYSNETGVPSKCASDSSVGPICFWTSWDISAVVTDLHSSGATTVLHQGVSTIAGQNVKVTQCET